MPDETTLAWPDYDGNRMYRSLGSIQENARVDLLFIRFGGAESKGEARLRINGRAEIDESAEAIAGLPCAKRLIRVTADHIFLNCPRYIPELAMERGLIHAPRERHLPPEPPWKARPMVKDLFDRERETKEGRRSGRD